KTAAARDWQRTVGKPTGAWTALVPLGDRPTVILATDAAGLKVDLFAPRRAALADVAEPQIAADAVEAETPRIAQTVGTAFGPDAGAADERVVARNGGLAGGIAGKSVAVDIEAQLRAEQGVGPLRIAAAAGAGAAAAAGALRREQVAVGSELN